MKLKHFAGYGSVTAEKVLSHNNGDGTSLLVVRVSGNHEYGLKPYDINDAYSWLFKRFVKNVPQNAIINISADDITTGDVEQMAYYFNYVTKF